jgi:cell division protein FtsL
MNRSNLIMVTLAALTAFLMFAVSYRVKELEHQLASVEQERAEAQRAIHVLRAEWSFLVRPDRLSGLAARHLDLRAVGVGQVVAWDAVPATAALAASDPALVAGAGLP